MKHILTAITCVVALNCSGQTQRFFAKQNLNCDFRESKANKYYKLLFVNQKSKALNCTYFFNFSGYSEKEKFKMIDELLGYEGDTSFCANKPKCYSASRSQTVPLQIERYSTQVEALFIINHIILSDPYSFSAFPIISDREGKSIESVSGPLIKQAYTQYREWLKKAKEIGLKKTLDGRVLPFSDNSQVLWF